MEHRVRRRSSSSGTPRKRRRKSGSSMIPIQDHHKQYLMHLMASKLTLEMCCDLFLKKFNLPKNIVVSAWNCVSKQQVDNFARANAALNAGVMVVLNYEGELDEINRENNRRHGRVESQDGESEHSEEQLR
eukprot:TRINITY_DN362_c0_g1_i3.p1 TRINITY_DN362_c0_g1~~TRINITY_DN362_c0_g1_i3.p1  ORF type:complete len:131 (+),score=24.34 TRINITY_DN362_c0_g1_i3:357-749(+)